MIQIRNLGPRFQRTKPAEIKIIEGKLAGKIFATLFKFEPTKTTLTLKLAEQTIGTAHADYDPARRLTTFFDAYIQEEMQMFGLSSLMVHLLFR